MTRLVRPLTSRFIAQRFDITVTFLDRWLATRFEHARANVRPLANRHQIDLNLELGGHLGVHRRLKRFHFRKFPPSLLGNIVGQTVLRFVRTFAGHTPVPARLPFNLSYPTAARQYGRLHRGLSTLYSLRANYNIFRWHLSTVNWH